MKNPERNVSEQVGTLGALLRLPYEILLRRLYGELAEYGFPDIRPAHSQVFRHILPGGSRVTDMAERAQMTKQSMGYLTEYLAERGYAEFVPDPTDGRAKLVQLTDRGRAVQEHLIAAGRQMEVELAQHLGAGEFAQLRTQLDRLRLYLEQREQDEEPHITRNGRRPGRG